jgi:hypothetical protein
LDPNHPFLIIQLREDGWDPTTVLSREDGWDLTTVLSREDGWDPTTVLSREDGWDPTTVLSREDGWDPTTVSSEMVVRLLPVSTLLLWQRQHIIVVDAVDHKQL